MLPRQASCRLLTPLRILMLFHPCSRERAPREKNSLQRFPYSFTVILHLFRLIEVDSTSLKGLLYLVHSCTLPPFPVFGAQTSNVT
jgi:hypothetical protein